MNILESLKSAFKNVFANKMRAFLTMLGIIIGIGSVIIITAIGQGNAKQISDRFESMGVGRITVRLSSREVTQNDLLTTKDVSLLSEIDDVKYISPVQQGSATLKLLNPTETKDANITGIYADYKNIQSTEILYGRYISENDVDTASRVAVINDTTAVKVFGYENAVGEKISLKTWRGTNKYTVVGISKNTNADMESMFGDDYPETVMMPLTSLQRLTGDKSISQITMIGADADKLTELAETVTKTLEKAHNNTNKYYVQNLMENMEQIQSVMGTVTLFIGFVAGISLLVGGIGVMNIMLVTVTERTREIGIRKSIGAKNSDILVQFIIESIILTGIGGMLGVILGYFGGNIVGSLISIEAITSVSAIVIAVGVSSGIGIIFGVYPAYKAAKLDPIEALRYE